MWRHLVLSCLLDALPSLWTVPGDTKSYTGSPSGCCPRVGPLGMAAAMNSFLPGPRLARPEAGESGSLTRPSILAGAAGQGSRDLGCLKACACREACRQPGSTAGLGPRSSPGRWPSAPDGFALTRALPWEWKPEEGCSWPWLSFPDAVFAGRSILQTQLGPGERAAGGYLAHLDPSPPSCLL